MKLLLVQPPIEDFYDTDIRLQPIGLAYLKGAVRVYLPEIDVKILDFHHGHGRYTAVLPEELHYLKPYYAHPDQSPFSTFHAYYRFGARNEVMGRQICAEKPDIVGISSLFSPYYREALTTASIVKHHSDAVTVLGGSHVSAEPEMMLAHPDVDFIICGEGEKPLVEFLKLFAAQGPDADWSLVAGLGYKKDGRLHFNDVAQNYAMQDLPFPDLSDLEPARYQFHKKPMTFMVTSRSCPHHCSFCSVHMTFGHDYRRNSMVHVIAEMKSRYAAGYRVFDFEDDNLTFYREPMKDLCREIVKEFPAKDIQLLAMNGISYLSLDDELMELMRAAGFTHLNLALVSSDKSVRETTKRPHTLDKYLQVVDKGMKLGFQMTSYQILGLPNETLLSMIQTLCTNAALPVLLGASMFYLTPNSPLAKQLKHVATPADVLKSRLTAMAIEANDFQRDDIYSLFIVTRMVNFVKSLPLIAGDVTLTDLLQGRGIGALDLRQRLGLDLLADFHRTRVLKAQTRTGVEPLVRFSPLIFDRVFTDLRSVRQPGGQTIFN